LVLFVAVPSLKSLASESKYSKCLDRMRAIGQASLIYSATDVAESAIPVHEKQFQQDPYDPLYMGAYEWGGKSGVGAPIHNFGYPPPYNSRYGTVAGFGPAKRPLNNILYPHGFRDNFPSPNVPLDQAALMKDTGLALDKYRCPADDGPPKAAHCYDWMNNPARTSFDHFGNSYAANTFMVQYSGGRISSNSPYLRPLSQVPNPSRVFNYEENIGRWAWACKRPIAECDWVAVLDPGPGGTVRGWHGKNWTYNFAFADGHVDKKAIYVEGTQDTEGYAEHYLLDELTSPPFPPNCSGCPPGSYCPGNEGTPEELNQTYRCIIVRGDGWQKDTLPAPHICTGLYWGYSGRPSFEGCVSD
jgi:prepilin-type processing-associated H-X9-DG protein